MEINDSMRAKLAEMTAADNELYEKRRLFERKLDDVRENLLEKGLTYTVRDTKDGSIVVDESSNIPESIQQDLNSIYSMIQKVDKEREQYLYGGSKYKYYTRLKRAVKLDDRKKNPLSVDDLKKIGYWVNIFSDEEKKVILDYYNNYPVVDTVKWFGDGDFYPGVVYVGKYNDLENYDNDDAGLVDTKTGDFIFPLSKGVDIDRIGRIYGDLGCPKSAKAFNLESNELFEGYDSVSYTKKNAIVFSDGKFGICDRETGAVIIPCEYDLYTLSKKWREYKSMGAQSGNSLK